MVISLSPNICFPSKTELTKPLISLRNPPHSPVKTASPSFVGSLSASIGSRSSFDSSEGGFSIEDAAVYHVALPIISSEKEIFFSVRLEASLYAWKLLRDPSIDKNTIRLSVISFVSEREFSSSSEKIFRTKKYGQSYRVTANYIGK
jgi:hypothetical protein